MPVLPCVSELLEQLATTPVAIASYKPALQAARRLLAEQFQQGTDVAKLVQTQACFIDGLLQKTWTHYIPADARVALIAVGGYGRGELHPASDIDLLILTADAIAAPVSSIEALLAFLWDIGLQIGHSVRSLSECIALAKVDVTVITNLLEARHLAGYAPLLETLRHQTSVAYMWTSADFFAAKCAEQQQRHAKVEGSAYNLEPNIKLNPGGLRDIQMVGWVAKRHFNVRQLSDLQAAGFLTAIEYASLYAGEQLLWRIRYALHTLTGRSEDRLLFEHQRTLAAQFGYTDTNKNLAVEQFMQRYYRTVIQLQRLNELLLQLFQEAMVSVGSADIVQPINPRFQARNGYLEVRYPELFRQQPLAMLELFLLLQQNPDLQGVRASTIRAIRAHRDGIDTKVRADIRARSLFMEILRQPTGITQTLRRMHRYGILSRYIPAFHQIMGLMQFDLFHVYTVDEHTLMVLRNVRRFAVPEQDAENAPYHQVWLLIAKPELLYLAALFHDLGKGRGGNHSELGASDAYIFCQQHGLSDQDCDLVAWLVKKHLFMSRVAQQQDIDDQAVVCAFVADMLTPQHLHALYLLTVADMQGTNPDRWSTWRSALLARLYQRAWYVMQQQVATDADTMPQNQAVQRAAQQQLLKQGWPMAQIAAYWASCGDDDFMQTAPEVIAWRADHYLQHVNKMQRMQVFMRQDEQHGCNEVFIFGPDRDGLFAQTTDLFDRLNLNILGARVDIHGPKNHAMSSFFVLGEGNQAVTAQQGCEIIQYLTDGLNQTTDCNVHSYMHHPLSRRLQNFARETQITFGNNLEDVTTRLELITHDRPGLLSQISRVLDKCQLRIHNATLVTEGAVAYDRFSVTNRNNQPIRDACLLNMIQQALIAALDH